MSRKKGLLFLFVIIVAGCLLYPRFFNPEPVPGLSVNVNQPTFAFSESQVTYEITVTNTGTCDLNVSVTDVFGFIWEGSLPIGEAKTLEHSFESPTMGAVNNQVEAVGIYKDLTASSSDTGSTQVMETHSLVEALEQGLITVEFLGTGNCAGESIRLKIKCEADLQVNVRIEPGWVLINSGSGQNMIISETRTVVLEPEVELTLDIEAYCLDIHKDNPSPSETLTLQEHPGVYGTGVVDLMCSLSTVPEGRRGISAVQIALWALQGDVSKDSISIKHVDMDIVDAKWLLENIGVDVGERKIFQELVIHPDLPLKITHQCLLKGDEKIHVWGEVENTESEPYEWIYLKAAFYDESGSLIWVKRDITMRLVLLPGEKAPFNLWVNDKDILERGLSFDGFNSYDVWIDSMQNMTEYPYRDYEASEVVVEDVDGELHVLGEVKNTGELERTFEVIISVYDKAGKIVGFGSYLQVYPKLKPGESTPFKIEGYPQGILDGGIQYWDIYVES
jgi:hypothetical protein